MRYPYYVEEFGTVPKLLWETVNDTVMGGVSHSTLLNKESTMVFSGVVSLENNGGFASTRASIAEELSDQCRGLRLRVRGDGSRYDFRIRVDGRYSRISYRSTFLASGKWAEFWFPWSSFRATFRGDRLVNIPPPQPDLVREVGFIIADGQQGPFTLEVDWIRAELGKT